MRPACRLVNENGHNPCRDRRATDHRPGEGRPATARWGDQLPRGERADRRGRGLRRTTGRAMAGCGRAFLPWAHGSQHRHVRAARSALHLSQSRHPRLCQCVVRPGRCCGRRSVAGGGHRIGVRGGANQTGNIGSCVRPCPRPGQSVFGAGDRDGRQRGRRLRRRVAGHGAPRPPRPGQLRAAGRSQSGCRSALAVLADRTSGSVCLPAQSACPTTGRERLSQSDTGRSTHEHDDSRRVGLAGADRAVHRSRCTGRRGGPATDDGLCRIRPHRAELACGTPCSVAHTAAFSAGRSPSDRVGRWRNGIDR